MKKLLFILGLLSIAAGVSAQDSTMQTQDTSMSKGMKKDCYFMKEGKLMMMKHGDTSMTRAMFQSVKLNNGATVGMDGMVSMPNGTTKSLKEGWYVDMDGKMGKMKWMDKDDKM